MCLPWRPTSRVVRVNERTPLRASAWCLRPSSVILIIAFLCVSFVGFCFVSFLNQCVFLTRGRKQGLYHWVENLHQVGGNVLFWFFLQTAPFGHVAGPCPKVLGKLRSGVGESLKSVSALGGWGGCFEGKSLLSLRASITANADGHHRPAGLWGPRPAEDWPLAACWSYSRERQTRLRTSHGGTEGAGAGGLGGCPAPRNRRKPLLRERVPAHTSALPFWFRMETCLFLPFPS